MRLKTSLSFSPFIKDPSYMLALGRLCIFGIMMFISELDLTIYVCIRRFAEDFLKSQSLIVIRINFKLFQL